MRLSRILPERKALVELDGRPAADVYNNELGMARSQIVDNVLVNPMGRAVGGSGIYLIDDVSGAEWHTYQF